MLNTITLIRDLHLGQGLNVTLVIPDHALKLYTHLIMFLSGWNGVGLMI